MRIERVDEKTVKCFLSNDELEEYDISYKDFVMRSEKAKEVVEEIIEQAEEEVGYQPPGFAFDLQIMLLPEEGMVLTFSEKDAGEAGNGRELMDCLKEMKELLEEKKRKMGLQISEVPNVDTQQAEEKEEKAPLKAPAAEEKKEKPQPPGRAVFQFESLRDVCAYAAVLPKGLRVKSALYQMNGISYLLLEKGAASHERYNRTCIQALEFGWLYSAEVQRIFSLMEHGDCVVAEHALRKLALQG